MQTDNLCSDTYYRGKWYSRSGIGYNQISDKEADMSVAESLLRCYDLKVPASTALRHEVIDVMQIEGYCGLPSQPQMPYIASTGADASRILLVRNGYVSIDKILDAIKAHRPRPKTEWKNSSDIFSTWTKKYAYIPTAKCPKFHKFLKEVQPNKDNREALQKMAGLCLIPNSSYEKVFVLCGAAGSGKTTFLNVLKAMSGKECYCSVPLARMPDVSNGILLTEKLVNFSSDMSLGKEPEQVEAFLKSVASGEEIPVEQPNGTISLVNARARCIFETNTLPRFSDRSNAVWDRLYPIPFNQVFRGTGKQNPHLADELIEQELPGILNWAIEGLFKLLQQRTFPLIEDGLSTLVDCRVEYDSAAAFFMGEIQFNPHKRLRLDTMYLTYMTTWVKEHGVSPVGMTDFTRTFLRMFPGAQLDESLYIRGIFYR